MAKGNINYKYLRRRSPSWFVRNWKFILVWSVLVLAVAALAAVIVLELM